MKRLLSWLGGLLLSPVRVPRRAWRAFRRSEPFPDVSWGYLLRFIRLPLLWLLAVITVYAIGWLTFIDPDNRWSAAEVFLGLAGGGAGLAALAGLAKQFEPARPKLRFEYSPSPTEKGNTRLTLVNDGTLAAFGVVGTVTTLVSLRSEELGDKFSYTPAVVALPGQRTFGFTAKSEIEPGGRRWICSYREGHLVSVLAAGSNHGLIQDDFAPFTPADRSSAPSSPPDASP